MSKITEKQLIDQLNQLKEIKPRKEWAVLLKSQILPEEKQTPAQQPAQFAGFMNIFAQRKFVYSFAAILLLIAGAFGIAQLLPSGTAQKSTASLTGQTGLKQNVVALNNLVQSVKKNKTASPAAIKNISANAKDLAQNLKNNPTEDSNTLNAIAASLKTLADVPGTDLTASPDVQDLTKAVVQSQIADLQKTTLTDDQGKTLLDAENLFNSGKYSDALEQLLDLTNTTSPTNK